MMSAKAISAAIKAKKKKMEDTESGAVKLSGIPEDATDEMVNENHIEGERLSENDPKDRDEEPASVAEQSSPQPHEESEPNPAVNGEGGEPDEEKMKRQAKMMALMARMGK